MDNRPIGVFDSGLGGLTVVRELLERLPHEDIVYFGDTGRVPYGSRSPEMVKHYAMQDCGLLLKQNVKYIIAACGTVSSVAGEVLKALPVPAMGVVEPTVEAALAATKTGRIGVIGTAVTVRSGSFEQAIKCARPDAQVFAQACPVLVTLVESGWVEENNPATEAVARQYLEPLMDHKIDTLILGCTHFPLLAPVISRILGESVTLINSGAATAAKCASLLQQRDMLSASDSMGSCQFFVSDQPYNFTRVAEMFLGRAVREDVRRVDMEGIG
ncbi:MAG: glutamate racemase [Clostridia bacterium]|nr:glutamate racemase [Clostridia bacterium]